MTADDIKCFIHGTKQYFTNVTSVAPTVSTPYILEADDHVVYDFSAVIGVSGSQRGCVYYSAPREMLRELVAQLGETMLSDELFADCVGEIANTISGNARERLGHGFMISVPVVFTTGTGRAEVHFPRDIPKIVIPLEWKNYSSSLIVALHDGAASEKAAEIDLSSLEDETASAE